LWCYSIVCLAEVLFCQIHERKWQGVAFMFLEQSHGLVRRAVLVSDEMHHTIRLTHVTEREIFYELVS